MRELRVEVASTRQVLLLLLVCCCSCTHAFAPSVPLKSPMTGIDMARRTSHYHLLARGTTQCNLAKDWSNWQGEEEEEDAGPPVKPDMKYVARNLKRQHDNFQNLRNVGGADVTHDIYARDPARSVWFFIGKVACISDVSPQQAVARQWNLLELHASSLRPLDLFPARGAMEIWIAPGDSEMQVAYNDPSIIMQKVNRDEMEDVDAIGNSLMGFEGETYEQGEEGFRTSRLEDGSPARPQIQGPSTTTPPVFEKDDKDALTRTPTDEEMASIQERLQGQDINALYEEQQRREGESLD